MARMSKALVSVIIGVYNKERYVEECLQSVLRQTYPHFELIVVDDCSTDGSLAKIRKVQDDRIRLVQLAGNSGRPAIPRNQGLAIARGKYLAFLDADDLWMPEKLEKQVAYMESYPEFLLVHAQCKVVDGDGNFLRLRHEGRLPPAGDNLLPLLEHCWISISSVMVKKALVDRIGVFDEDPGLRAREDYAWLLRAAVTAPFGVIEECLAMYRSSEDSISHMGGNWRSSPRDFLSHRNALDHSERWCGKIGEKRLVEIAFRAAEENAYFWRRRKEAGKAAWFAWQMIRLDPWVTGGWRHLMAAAMRRGG